MIRNLVVALVAASFVAIGVMHFTHADVFVHIMPPALPAPLWLVWISGVCEIAGGIGLAIPATRTLAGWGLLALLVAVFPANIHMAINEVYLPIDVPQSPLGLWLRLPFQFVFAGAVWFAMGPHNRRKLFWTARAEDQTL